VREEGRIVGGEWWQEKVHNREMEETPENGKESSHSAHVNGINKYLNPILHICINVLWFRLTMRHIAS